MERGREATAGDSEGWLGLCSKEKQSAPQHPAPSCPRFKAQFLNSYLYHLWQGHTFLAPLHSSCLCQGLKRDL